MTSRHIPVLLNESIESLNLGPEKIFLDTTLGGGGHSREALRRYPSLRIIGLDLDAKAVERARKELGIKALVENFSNLDVALERFNVKEVDAILFDLGLSADELEKSGKGFSFLRDEPLDMRMSDEGIRARDILNSWSEEALELILRGFGEERYSRKIAREIVRKREGRPFERTADLVEAVLAAKPKTYRNKIHPATKTFQALRIAVNEELQNLETGLKKGFEALRQNGRLAVISFHSLEDRIVKNFFRETIKEGRDSGISNSLRGTRPIVAGKEEVRRNPRARSAKLRVIQKI